MKRWPVSDTGVPTFAETDTACADGVPERHSHKRGVKNHPNTLVLVNLFFNGARGAPEQREDTGTPRAWARRSQSLGQNHGFTPEL